MKMSSASVGLRSFDPLDKRVRGTKAMLAQTCSRARRVVKISQILCDSFVKKQ